MIVVGPEATFYLSTISVPQNIVGAKVSYHLEFKQPEKITFPLSGSPRIASWDPVGFYLDRVRSVDVSS